ncbi:MAG: DUF4935 domain-containing protein [Flavobacteriales bacterium]|nr:DUF4935 domain-containing protein [Flavobacteriales bacterium]
MEKVIFDTNFIRNTEPKKFLGSRRELEKFVKIAEIVFPDLVIEEIKHQKRRSLTGKKQSFLDNPFHWLKNLDVDETKSFDIEAHILSLENDEKLEFNVIKLTDYSVLEQMKELALKKLPPFEAGDNTDKGFKDAYIYFTILEYLQSISDKVIFVCTKDGRLKEALEKHPSIIVVKDYDDFIHNSVTEYFDDYFIEKLKTDIHADIDKESIVDYWVNINENRVLLIETEGEKTVVEVDSGEIIDYRKAGDYSTAIINLINTSSFADTHFEIDALSPYLHFLSDDEIISILEATIDNGQIGSIISDDDVKQFISTLYEKKKGMLAPELEAAIKERLG